MKAFVVPIFIPNVGCPTRCVFCEQPRITSQSPGIPSPETVSKTLWQAIKSKKYKGSKHAQVAFYGGTFTRLPLTKMVELLKAVKPFIEEGYFESIRISTRPDSLAPDRIELMKSYWVKTVELGAQSLDDRVLAAANRGHTAQDTIDGLRKLRSAGFSVGIQLMPGLPLETKESFQQTVMKTIKLRPDFVRLYPTIVIEGTKLAEMYRSGRYTPLSLEDAVDICAEAVTRFEEEQIPVIRIGLMSSPTLLQDGQVLAGPWHPSFGELVRARVYQNKIAQGVPKGLEGRRIHVSVNPKDLSLLRGHKNRGLRYLEGITGASVVSVDTDVSVEPNEIRVSLV